MVTDQNLLVLSVVLSLLISQLAKTIIQSVKDRKVEPIWLWNMGHMPSSHAAVLGALCLSLFLTQGYSVLFVTISVISIAIIRLTIRKEYNNHTIMQVAVGLCIGMLSSLLIWKIL